MVSLKQIPGEVGAFGDIAYNGMCLMMFLTSMAHSFGTVATLFFGILSLVAIVKMIRNILHFISLRKQQESENDAT